MTIFPNRLDSLKYTLGLMKIKLLFFLLIVLCLSCSKKTLKGDDAAYYRREIEKSKRLAQQPTEKELMTPKATQTASRPSYLSNAEKEKFAALLEVAPEVISNEKLYAAIDTWLGTPYDWGGTTKGGVDCSSYVQQIYRDVYGQELPRTSVEQFYMDTKAHFKDQKYLKEGDLVFFRLRHQDKVVSHVGIYLQNGKFTGSNSPHGVVIADLGDSYWQDKYVACARLLKN